MVSMDWAETNARRDENHLRFGAAYIKRFYDWATHIRPIMRSLNRQKHLST